jgi:anti-sigma factor RsiW
MNENKLKQLLAAARAGAAPEPSADFAADVLRAVRQEPPPRPAGPPALAEQLNRWCARLAVAAAALILVCVFADRGLTAVGLPEVSDGATQLAAQYLFNANPEDL